MAKSQINLQDTFLNLMRREKTAVIIYLVNGVQLRGQVKGFDNFTILLDSGGKVQLVYKSAITTVAPLEPGKHLSDLYAEALQNRDKSSAGEDEAEEDCDRGRREVG